MAKAISAIADGSVNPSHAASPPSRRAEDPERNAHLAARGTRQELTEGHQIGVRLLVHPLPPDDVFVPEVPEDARSVRRTT
jgi:hypothetical protein